MAKTKKTTSVDNIEFNKVRGMIRKELETRYGGVSKFLNSESGKKFGGMKIKIYLFDTGPVNFNVISELCEYLGLGKFTRKIVVSRSFLYQLTPSDTDSKKPS